MTTIAARLQAVNARIAVAARAAGRLPQDVTLVAVSKTFPATAVAEGHAAGQRAFGENYVQEAQDKMAALAGRDIEWHFIGPIQSNKTRPIAEAFAWVHGVDREKTARRLSDARPAGLPPLQVCLQVNVSGEASKSGVGAADVLPLARAVAALPRLRLRGLMAIPEPTEDAALQRARFRRLRELKEEIVAAGIAMDTLSMGMSGDMEAAIAEGATMVRIGTAIFGARPAIRASIA
ncbi:MAG TPA: YggS family pyridoxal phosphate-dependent enzyme [Burkholderiales bacterium]|jgi:pyridoxal phosphate enzyme (YggS family)|nr:YggS family pyridoxal phosphate-dependent enzyme [Burkholderiales bacterium]